MPIFVPMHEHGDPSRPGPYPHGEGQGAPPEKRKRPGRMRQGPGYTIGFRSQWGESGRSRWLFVNDFVQSRLTPEESYKLRSARVHLFFDGSSTAHLGAPTKWQAPNGVTVVYVRGQRRTEIEGASSTYHDFNVAGDERVVPLTRNVGAGRRALQAWARQFVTNKATVRFRARQLVRPGD